MGLLFSEALAQEAVPPVAKSQVLPPEALIMVLMAAIFYFLVIRPQQKTQRTHRDMVGSVKRGDKVVTGGGIMGTVAKVEESDVLLVDIAPGVTVQVAKNTLLSVMPTDKAIPGERRPKAKKGDALPDHVANDN